LNSNNSNAKERMDSKSWEELLSDEPTNELLRFSYAKALLDEKQWSLAATEFKKLVEQKPDYALAWAFLARSAFRAGDKLTAEWACELGLPVATAQKHEIPLEELMSVLEEIKAEF